MQQNWSQIKSQLLSIFVTALISAGLAFVQSLSAQTCGTAEAATMVKDAGIFGLAFKSLHSTYSLIHGKIG